MSKWSPKKVGGSFDGVEVCVERSEPNMPPPEVIVCEELNAGRVEFYVYRPADRNYHHARTVPAACWLKHPSAEDWIGVPC